MYQVSSLHDLCIKGYRTDGKAEGLTALEPRGSYVPSFKSPRPLYQRLSHRWPGRKSGLPLNQEDPMYQFSSLHDLCIKGYRTDGRAEGLTALEPRGSYVPGYRTYGKADERTALEPGGSYVPSFKSPRPLYQRLSHRWPGRKSGLPLNQEDRMYQVSSLPTFVSKVIAQTARQRDRLPLNQEGHMYKVSSLPTFVSKVIAHTARQTNGLPLNQ
ncbi:hypothetical protein J6590_029122 [Homalodisca vitripennis]|nr:hypothetical protein J6590_029122 [Homalodisca vitripennis]